MRRFVLFPPVLVIALSFFLFAPSIHPVQAATYYVDDDDPICGGNSPCYSTMQPAIDAASSGDTVQVAAGTYFENIIMKSGVLIQGAGAGDDPLNHSIIDGGASGSVVTAIGVDSTATLDGFTITGGFSDYGGGMYNNGSSPTVTNCIFTLNYARDRGGGMYNRQASPTVSYTTFLQNTAEQMGGGMFNIQASSPTISKCTFTENIANKGAGMRNYILSHPTVTDSIFYKNHAGEEGGGMDNRKDSNPVVTRCSFIGNTAGESGGGMHNYIGGTKTTDSNPIIRSSLFARNFAEEGSAMRNNDPDPVIINTTFAYNQGGAAIRSQNGSRPFLLNCIVWGHDEGSFGGETAASTIVEYSDIEGGFPGIGNLDVDPLFVDPDGPDNIPGNKDDNYRLTSISPLIDAGLNDHPLHPLPATDLDGEPRIMGGTVDMGAYELSISMCSAADETDGDGDGYSLEGVICGPIDCNDNDPSIHPNAAEVCNGVDDDCDGTVDEGFDTDNDGYTTCQGDCDDSDPIEHPNQTWYRDADKDGYSNGVVNTTSCNRPEGYKVITELTAISGDCDDDNISIYPGATEVCDDSKDNDCDGQIDSYDSDCLVCTDNDGDGYTTCAGDCDDSAPDIYPGATELCDGKDNDCDDVLLATEVDADTDGQMMCEGDCNDGDATIYFGATEVCDDSKDNDCDDSVDEGCGTVIDLSVAAYKIKGDKYADLTWSGATSTNVDVYCDGSLIATTANDSAYTDGPFGKGKPKTYQVCEAGTTTCSNEVTVSW